MSYFSKAQLNCFNFKIIKIETGIHDFNLGTYLTEI